MILRDSVAYFCIKTYVIGAHKNHKHSNMHTQHGELYHPIIYHNVPKFLDTRKFCCRLSKVQIKRSLD